MKGHHSPVFVNDGLSPTVTGLLLPGLASCRPGHWRARAQADTSHSSQGQQTHNLPSAERQGRDAAWHRHHHHLAISVFPHQAFCPVFLLHMILDQGQGGTYPTNMGDGRVWQSSLWLHQLGSLWWASLIKQWHMGHTATAWQWQPPRPSWLYFAAATLRCMQPCIPMQRSILVLLNFHLSRWNCQLLTDFY